MRRKERTKIIQQTTISDVLYSLSKYPEASRILLSSRDSEYSAFLENLLKNSFFGDTENYTVKFVAEATGAKREKATKWIRQIYDDIFLLNGEQPDLFKTDGTKCSLYFNHYDMYCAFYRSLKFIPRQFEYFSWEFVRGKMNRGDFWVKRIEYDLNEEEPIAHIFLDGGVLNLYEVLLKDRALFDGVLDLFDENQLQKFEVSDILKKHYKCGTD